ncbi:hypothetical protein [Limosilactobacillus fermentum]|uniref:hypothetical protein n=2 Tax=Limosilactobacillus fermentum TaxID=1613 RepID=UPI00062D164D|nr:hypothetical protein [Limosilactobacillus fermentum]KLD46981.1 hypothetical protein WU69_08765 [Limosilactobacillus fermentum]MCT3441994.1 hypothetical protein [Limosilactobacillus fermentum]MDC6079626.1 hypothetical protein [Limosilactobacillus fermentum]
MLLRIERLALLMLVITYLLTSLVTPEVATLQAMVAVVVLVTGFSRLGTAFKVAAGLFLVAGSSLLVISHAPFVKVVQSINGMNGFVVLLLVMQLFTIPLAIGNYQEAIEEVSTTAFRSAQGLNGFIMAVTFVLASILSLGTVPLMYTLLQTTVHRWVEPATPFLATAVSWVIIMGTLWAPGAATIFVVATVTHQGWGRLFLPSLGLGVLGMGLSLLLTHAQYQIKNSAVLGKHSVTGPITAYWWCSGPF